MKILVHACCGPCSIMPTKLLMEQGHDITAFYANSNIAPQAEYERRLAELRRYGAAQHFEVVEGAYDPAAWERVVAPIGEALKQYSPAFGAAFGAAFAGRPDAGARDEADDSAHGATDDASPVPETAQAPAEAVPDFAKQAPATVAELLDDERRRERCRACYRMRLEEAAAYASERGFDALATTLAVSPYQFTDVIREETERAAARAGIAAHFEDYRPYYDEATRISRELGMYRQNYCGCRFSVREGEATRAFVKQQRKAEKAERAAQRAAKDAARASEDARRKADRQAYAEAQAKKKAILKAMRKKS